MGKACRVLRKGAARSGFAPAQAPTQKDLAAPIRRVGCDQPSLSILSRAALAKKAERVSPRAVASGHIRLSQPMLATHERDIASHFKTSSRRRLELSWLGLNARIVRGPSAVTSQAVPGLFAAGCAGFSMRGGGDAPISRRRLGTTCLDVRGACRQNQVAFIYR